ncbi:alpha/beta fold hydrolase [Streptomyces sp. NPDC048258]|uniref:alpha/beta fold hydrolase n=1 Tax=Streptomyces sp. NPDC048258 TaxID=3365527 RepID=UPI0037110781
MSADRYGMHRTEHGSGPAVLWIHGYTMDSSLWRPLWELLPGWRHIGVDLPGHGASAPMERGLTLPALAARLAELAVAEDAVRVVGLSFGSMVALQLAMDAPEAVRSLVVGAPTLAGGVPDPAARARYIELMTLRRAGGAPEQMANLWMQSPPDIFRGTEAHPELRSRLRAVIARHSWAELDSGAIATLSTHRHTPDALAGITARTLAIVGDSDMPAFTANAELLRRTVPVSEVRTVADAGHLPLLERPEAVAALMGAHFRTATPEATARTSQLPAL